MRLVSRLRIPALLCAFSVPACELIARSRAEMGICDDAPYILMARTLATTGHFAFNGWAAPMLGWQLYLGATFIKLFGFSFTCVRGSTLLVAMALAFVLQRTLVRANISELNATLGTLALVLSPLYLMLSVTYMTDIFGFFAIVICLYACLRSLQATFDYGAIFWLCFAVVANSICGTARQIAWLGILVMIPSALWLLRAKRKVFISGLAANLAGAVFIVVCLHWLKHQPYIVPVPPLVRNFPFIQAFEQVTSLLLEIPFLLLSVGALFILQIRRLRPVVIAALAAVLVIYVGLALSPHHTHGIFLLQPTHGDWVSTRGFFDTNVLKGTQPIFLNFGTQIFLTIVSIGALLVLIASLETLRRDSPVTQFQRSGISWKQLGVLFVPYSTVYILLLLSVYATTLYLFDRYLLGLLLVALVCLVRYQQERILHPHSLVWIFLVFVMAAYGIVVTHNMFSFYRARIALAAEFRDGGIPETSVDNGWEYNFAIELQHATHINYPTIAVPLGSYVPARPLPQGTCSMFWSDFTPHIRPLYGISFDPKACYGPAPFPPVSYSRWLATTPGTLYAVRYTSPSRP